MTTSPAWYFATSSVARDRRVDRGVCVDAAFEVEDVLHATRDELLGDAAAALTVVTVDDDAHVRRERSEVFEHVRLERLVVRERSERAFRVGADVDEKDVLRVALERLFELVGAHCLRARRRLRAVD